MSVPGVAKLRRQCIQFVRRPLRRQAGTLLRVLCVIFILLFGVVFVTPVRNALLPIFLPATMTQVSSEALLRMYWLEPQIDENSQVVDCRKIQSTLDTVDWAAYVREMDSLPSYDDAYFQQLRKQPGDYGIQAEDVDHFQNRYRLFMPPISSRQQKELRLVNKVFRRALELFNVTYFFMEGSMLGVYRHHGLTPWDDDMDVAINGTDWFKVKQILRCVPGFDVDTSTYMMYKFFYEKSLHPVGESFYTYPNIDIFFYTDDNNFMWSLSRIKKHRMLYKVSDIFPLKYRPFEGELVPVPRDYIQLCSSVYDPESCVSRDYDHFRNRPLVPFVEYEYVPCEFFKKIFPFVKRTSSVVGGVNTLTEFRMIGSKVLSNFTVPSDPLK